MKNRTSSVSCFEQIGRREEVVVASVMVRNVECDKKQNSKKIMMMEAVNMAWPAVCESFFIALASIVDTFMVSSLGATAVAAVGLTTQPKFMGLSVFTAMSVSVSAIVARRRGEQRQKAANEVLLAAILFALFGGIIVGLLTAGFADDIMRFCGSNEDTHDMAVSYFRIIMGGIVFHALSLGINAAQRGTGNTIIAMKTNVTSNVINIIGNFLLIEGHFGFPALGIQGAAIATVAGTVMACFMSLWSLRKPKAFISISYLLNHKIRPSITPFISIIKVGYSVFIEQILTRIGFMSTAIMVAKLGTSIMAAHQLGMNIMSLSFAFGDGMQAAAVTLLGRSLGEGKPNKAKEYGGICRKIGFCISIALAVFYFTFGEALCRLFFEEEEIIHCGVQIFHVVIFIVMFQVSQVIYMGCLRGAGDTSYTAFASILSVTIIRTAVSYICCFVFGWGITGIWLGILADQISRYLFGSIRFRIGKWTKICI